jgi:hypothetical protein
MTKKLQKKLFLWFNKLKISRPNNSVSGEIAFNIIKYEDHSIKIVISKSNAAQCDQIVLQLFVSSIIAVLKGLVDSFCLT